MTRSTSVWWAAKTPVARNRASTSVVLPWSTWATSATLRNLGGFTSHLSAAHRRRLRRLGLPVVLVVVILIERDAVLLSDGGVLVVLGGRLGIGVTRPEPE